jgi:acyl-CoA thioesterase I
VFAGRKAGYQEQGMQSGYRAPRRQLQCTGWRCGIALVLLAAAALVQAADPAPVVRPKSAPQRTVLVMGDSLSAAYGLAPSQGWVALTGARLAREKPGWRLVNASISGETSAGGAARVVHEVVLHRPAVVVIALGANDGLRGLPLRQTRTNLARMIGAAHGIGAKVLLVGMRMPPNYGAAYTRDFERSFPQLAERFDTALLPFLLEPIVRDRNAFQDDNLHPVARVQPALRDHVWTALAPLLK